MRRLIPKVAVLNLSSEKADSESRCTELVCSVNGKLMHKYSDFDDFFFDFG